MLRNRRALVCAVFILFPHPLYAQAPAPSLDIPASEGEAAPDERPEAEPAAEKSKPSASPSSTESDAPKPVNAVRIQGLNKVTARISTMEALIGTVVRFGTIEFIAKRCWKAPPEEQPENAALLDIWELKNNEEPQKIFSGWMFASSPALSALEHPVYDITVLECINMATDGE